MVSRSFSWLCRGHRHDGLLVVAMLLSCLAAPAVAADRHAGYYDPEPATSETYKARTLTLGEASREMRIGFIVTLTNKMLNRPYPPGFAVFVVVVHQEADRAAIHAVDRHAAIEEAMQGFKHESVAAQRDDDIGVLRIGVGIAFLQQFPTFLRLGRAARNDGKLFVFH